MSVARIEPPASVDAHRAPAVQTSTLLNALPHLLKTLRREPAVAITLGYILVALAGIFYNYSFYRRFGIPVLTLSQITDFLVAGLQQPIALLLLLSTFPMIWLFDKHNQHLRRKQDEKRRQLAAAPDTR